MYLYMCASIFYCVCVCVSAGYSYCYSLPSSFPSCALPNFNIAAVENLN